MDYYLTNTCLRYLGAGYNNKFSFLYSHLTNDGNQIEYKINIEKFRRLISSELEQIKAYPTRKQFLIILHIAYAKTISLNIENKKFILLHEHYSYRFKDAMLDFPCAKNIVNTRDLRNSYASYIKKNELYEGYLSPLYTIIDLNCTLDTYVNAIQFQKKFPKDIYFIKTEKLNLNPQLEMKNLVAWIGINFLPLLLRPTYAGYKIKGISVFNSKQNGFDKKGLCKKRWLDVCSNREIILLNAIHYNFNLRFGYYTDTGKMTFLKFIILVLTPDITIFKKRYKTHLSRLIYFFIFGYFFTRFCFIRNYIVASTHNKYKEPPTQRLKLLNNIIILLGLN